jgi:predicted metal-dependent hydrolase
MTTESHELIVSGIPVSVVRKRIKNLHLGVYPPDGRVRVAVPLTISDEAVRIAVIGKLRWIRRQQAAFEGQARQSRREMLAGESHYYLGRRYRLAVSTTQGKSGVTIRSRNTLELRGSSSMTIEQRERVLGHWYRERLRALATPLIERWQGILGVTVEAWGIKKMKTKWGSCNANARRIWLNLELVKKPPECLEYLIVHALIHLLVRHHDERFHALMNQHLPKWQASRKTLNAAPLAHEVWNY